MAKRPKRRPKHEPEVEGAVRGRPTLYKPAFVAQAKKLCELGATEFEIADFFEVNVSTIHRWKHRYPDFCNAIKTAKEIADERVERALYHKAVGYTYNTEKLFMHNGVVLREQTVEHVPPDTTAQIFWLKNRRSDVWRDRREVDQTVTQNGPSPQFLEFVQELNDLAQHKRLTIEHRRDEDV